MKINTDIIALRLLCTSLISIFFELKYPSANRFWYSGSSTSSLPTFIEKSAPTSTPIMVAGIVILRISNRVMSKPANSPSKATVAAEMGLAVMACCEAMTAMPRGRSDESLFRWLPLQSQAIQSKRHALFPQQK